MPPYSKEFLRKKMAKKLARKIKSKKADKSNYKILNQMAKAAKYLPGPAGVVGEAIMAATAGTQTRSRKGSRTSGYLGGKVGRGKRNNYRTRGKKGKLTEYGIARSGITLNYESRKEVSAKEALAIGHTTMPGKVCLINVFRALIKRFMLEMKLVIKDYGTNLVGIGFVVGDIIRINRYAQGNSSTIVGDVFTIANTWTFDTIAALMFDFYDGTFPLSDDRWDSIEFLPQSTSRFSGINLNLVSAKVTVHTKSALKIQNITTEVAADNEADDVNAVVLSGKTYQCKGNNFVKKSNSVLLNGLFSTFNEEALFLAFDKQDGSVIGGTDVPYYHGNGTSNNVNTTFFKPAEPPKFWEIQNCKSTGKITVAPGAIKTSVLTSSYSMSLQFYLNMLLGNRQVAPDLLVYNEKQGKTNVMYLEKVVGRTSTDTNDIKLWTELDFKQSVVVNTSLSRYSLPIQFQTNY